MASALLSTLILLVAAGVINTLVVRQAQQQVQSEVENLLPVYNAIWDEMARSLAAVGTTMANAPITKVVFGNARAAQDRATIHELIVDLSSETTAHVDLIFLTDGAGKISYAEIHGAAESRGHSRETFATGVFRYRRQSTSAVDAQTRRGHRFVSATNAVQNLRQRLRRR